MGRAEGFGAGVGRRRIFAIGYLTPPRTLGGVRDPTAVDDDYIGRIPVAILIQTIIKTPSIVDRGLRELHMLRVRRDVDTLGFHLDQFFSADGWPTSQ